MRLIKSSEMQHNLPRQIDLNRTIMDTWYYPPFMHILVYSFGSIYMIHINEYQVVQRNYCVVLLRLVNDLN